MIRAVGVFSDWNSRLETLAGLRVQLTLCLVYLKVPIILLVVTRINGDTKEHAMQRWNQRVMKESGKSQKDE